MDARQSQIDALVARRIADDNPQSHAAAIAAMVAQRVADNLKTGGK